MDPITASLLAAGASAATPFVSKVLGSAFGLDEASQAEKNAVAEMNRVAQGGTTQAQAGAAYQRGKTLQDLQAMASKGTAQQRAGLQHQAMLQAPEIQAQQAAQLADIRAREQERARSLAAQYEAVRAAKELKSKQQMLGGAIEGAGGILAKQLLTPAAPNPNQVTAEQANQYNLGQAAANAYKPFSSQQGGTSGDLGAGWTARGQELQGDAYRALGQAPAAPATQGATAPAHVPIASDITGSGMDLASWQTTPKTSGRLVPQHTPIASDMSGSVNEVAPASLGQLYDPTELYRANLSLDKLQAGRVGDLGVRRTFRRGSL